MGRANRGRPTDNPKNTKINVRLDEDTLDKLDSYCKKKDVSRSEAVREGINKLDEK